MACCKLLGKLLHLHNQWDFINDFSLSLSLSLSLSVCLSLSIYIYTHTHTRGGADKSLPRPTSR